MKYYKGVPYDDPIRREMPIDISSQSVNALTRFCQSKNWYLSDGPEHEEFIENHIRSKARISRYDVFRRDKEGMVVYRSYTYSSGGEKLKKFGISHLIDFWDMYWDIDIKELDDQYFDVVIIYSQSKDGMNNQHGFYRCDQVEGVIRLVSDFIENPKRFVTELVEV